MRAESPRTSPRRRPRPRPSPRRPPPRFTEASANDRGEGARTPSTASLPPKKHKKTGSTFLVANERDLLGRLFLRVFGSLLAKTLLNKRIEKRPVPRFFLHPREPRRSASSHHAVPLSLADLYDHPLATHRNPKPKPKTQNLQTLRPAPAGRLRSATPTGARACGSARSTPPKKRRARTTRRRGTSAGPTLGPTSS